MDFRFNPLAKFPHGHYYFGLLVFQEGGCRPVIREASGEGALLVARLLCSRPHNNPYAVFVIMWCST